MKKLVYISHAYGNKPENKAEVEEIIKRLYSDDKITAEYCFVSPIHNYDCLYSHYEKTDYYKGLSFCTDLLLYCDEMWVFCDWKDSKGCIGEIELAKDKFIPIRYIESLEELDKFIKEEKYRDKRDLNPMYFRDIKRNVILYTTVKMEETLKNDKEFKRSILRKILYTSLSDAIDKQNRLSDINPHDEYSIVEVEVSLDNLLDLSSNQTISTIQLFIDSENIDCEELGDNEIVNKFMDKYSKFYSVIKRVITSNTPIFKGSKIKSYVKTLYKVYNEDAIINVHKFSGYPLGYCNGNGVFKYPFKNK